jgi:hypothetical protein
MSLKKIPLAAVVLAAATPASAANFAITSGCGEDPSDKSCTTIHINGQIEPGDHTRWKALLETTKTPHAIVALNSPGGSLPDGLLIGYDILNREYDTYHSEGICYSACALIWLAGKTRYMSSGAKLGFHQSKEKDLRGNTRTPEDLKEREEEATKQAQEDKRKCELVQSGPKLEKRLQELQSAAEKKN